MPLTMLFSQFFFIVATNGAGIDYPFRATEVIPAFFVWFVLLNL